MKAREWEMEDYCVTLASKREMELRKFSLNIMG